MGCNHQDERGGRLTVLKPMHAAEPVGGAGPARDLRPGGFAPFACSRDATERLGRVNCIQNREASATVVLVFAPDGSLVREVAAGQGGVDLRLR